MCVLHAHKLSSGVFMHAQNIGQPVGADFLLIQCGSQGLSSGHLFGGMFTCLSTSLDQNTSFLNQNSSKVSAGLLLPSQIIFK